MRYVVDLKKNEGSKTLLVCFPPAGSSATFYRKLALSVGSDVNVSAIQLPGRANRYSESMVYSVDYIVNSIASELTERCEQDPVFFGYSMGGMLAFLTAKRMFLDGGVKPKQLYVASCLAPKETKNKRIRAFTGRGQFEALMKQYPEVVQSLTRRIYMSSLHDHDFIEYLKAVGVLSADIVSNAELLSLALPVFRADFRMLESMVYKDSTNKLDLPLFIMSGGACDHGFTGESLTEWKDKTSSVCQFKDFGGDIFYVKRNSNEFTTYVRETLAKRI